MSVAKSREKSKSRTAPQFSGTRRPIVAKGNKPDFNARAKVGDYWSTIGAAWNVKDGGISIRLNMIPVGNEWDGSVLLLPPKEDEGAKPE